MVAKSTSNEQSVLKRIWWLVLIRGILALLLGIISLLSPLITGITLTIVFGAYAVVDGITGLGHAWRNSRRKLPYGWILFGAVVSLLAGIAALLAPILAAGIAAIYLTITIAGWAILFGLSSVFGSKSSQGSDKAWSIISGLITLIAGIVLVVFAFAYPPVALLATIIWVIGIYAVILGVSLIVIALRMRKRVQPSNPS